MINYRLLVLFIPAILFTENLLSQERILDLSRKYLNLPVSSKSVEVFIDGGAYSYSMKREARPDNISGLVFFGDDETEVISLKVYPMKSIWKGHDD